MGQPADLDLNALLNPLPRLFHLSGITLAISESSSKTAQIIWEACQARGVSLSFDVNYRAKLWTPNQARAGCEFAMQTASLIFIPERDAMTIYGTSDLSELHARYPQATLIMTKGANGASLITPDGEFFHQDVFPVETVCRIGGGDAFSAGYLYGHANHADAKMCLRYGTVVAALKYTLPGDLPLIDRQQVFDLIKNTVTESVQR